MLQTQFSKLMITTEPRGCHSGEYQERTVNFDRISNVLY